MLISVTVAGFCTAQITAGEKTTEEEGCLRKDKDRNKSVMGCKHPLARTQTKHTLSQSKLLIL